MNRQQFLLLFVVVLVLFSVTAGCGPIDRIDSFFSDNEYADHAKLIDFGLFFVIFFGLTYLGLTSMWGQGFGKGGSAKGAIIGISIAFALMMSFAIVTQTSFSITTMFPLARMIFFLVVFFLLWGLLMKSGMFGNNTWTNRIVTFILAAMLTYLLASIATHMICQVSDNMDNEALCGSDILNAVGYGYEWSGLGDWVRGGEASRRQTRITQESSGPMLGGCRLDLTFPQDSSDPSALAGQIQSYLQRLAQLENRPTIHVYGFASDEGTWTHNSMLSSARASNVAQMIREMDIAGSHFSASPHPKHETDIFGQDDSNRRIILSTASMSRYLPAPGTGTVTSTSEGACPEPLPTACENNDDCQDASTPVCAEVEGRRQCMAADCAAQRCLPGQEDSCGCSGETPACQRQTNGNFACVASQEPPQECAEYCPGRCEGSRCMVCEQGACPDGSECGQCSDGQSCECGREDEGWTCRSGLCQATAGAIEEGGPCLNDDECQSGLACIASQCTRSQEAEEEVAQGSLAHGAQCTSDGQCLSRICDSGHCADEESWVVQGEAFARENPVAAGGLGIVGVLLILLLLYLLYRIGKKAVKKGEDYSRFIAGINKSAAVKAGKTPEEERQEQEELKKAGKKGKVVSRGFLPPLRKHKNKSYIEVLDERKVEIDKTSADLHDEIMAGYKLRKGDLNIDSKAAKHIEEIEKRLVDDLHWKDILTLAQQHKDDLKRIKQEEQIFEEAEGYKIHKIPEQDIDGIIQILRRMKDNGDDFDQLDPETFKVKATAAAVDLLNKNKLHDKQHAFFREQKELRAVLDEMEHNDSKFLGTIEPELAKLGADNDRANKFAQEKKQDVMDATEAATTAIQDLKKHIDATLNSKEPDHRADYYVWLTNEFLKRETELLEIVKKSLQEEARVCRELAKFQALQAEKIDIIASKDKFIDELEKEHALMRSSLENIGGVIQQVATSNTGKDDDFQVTKTVVDDLEKDCKVLLRQHFALQDTIYRLQQTEAVAAQSRHDEAIKEIEDDTTLMTKAPGKAKEAIDNLQRWIDMERKYTEATRQATKALQESLDTGLSRAETLSNADYHTWSNFKNLWDPQTRQLYIEELYRLSELLQALKNQRDIFKGIDTAKAKKGKYDTPIEIEEHFKKIPDAAIKLERDGDSEILVKPGTTGGSIRFRISKSDSAFIKKALVRMGVKKDEMSTIPVHLKVELYVKTADYGGRNPKPHLDEKIRAGDWNLSIKGRFTDNRRRKLTDGQGVVFEVLQPMIFSIEFDVPENASAEHAYYVYLVAKLDKDKRNIQSHTYEWIKVGAVEQVEPALPSDDTVDAIAVELNELKDESKTMKKTLADVKELLRQEDFDPFLEGE